MVETGLIKLEFRLLGSFTVILNGTPIPAEQWKGRKVRGLVKLLALAPGHRLHRDQLIETFWPDSNFTAAVNSFHQTLYNTRRLLETSRAGELVLEDGFLSLVPAAGQVLQVDVEQFEIAAAQTRDSQDPILFQSALGLYHGDLLTDDLYEEWTFQRRESLRQVYLKLLLDLARLYESQHNYSSSITALLELLTVDKSHEEANARLMRLYALSGQRQQALRQYQTLHEVLQVELNAEPSESTIALYDAIQSDRISAQIKIDTRLQSMTAARKHNLPHLLTSFIGREKQINEVNQLVKDHRLVTLAGAGGTGKTRLALVVAEGLLEYYPDGIFLVDLASLSDPELVTQACLMSLSVLEEPGTPRLARLVQYLEKKNLLLILDNCEHVISACIHLVDALTKGCPQLHILATSREILSVPGESAYRVPSLTILDPDAILPFEELTKVESIRLFVDRAVQVSPEFKLTVANANLVGQIGRRLDGIPLAIELAAARIRVLSVEQITIRLDDAFRLLTGGSRAVLPRQQTLKATMDWSYELLLPKERLLLQRITVFAGGWGLEAAEQVCTNTEGKDITSGLTEETSGTGGELSNYCLGEQIERSEVIDLLTQLVDKSLVIVEAQVDKVRYRLLETIRQYACERLVESGCSQIARDRHLAFFARMTGQAESHLRGTGQIEWLDRLEEELDNLRAAMEWGRERKIESALQIAADLMWFWHMRGLFFEGTGWEEMLLAAEVQQRAGRDLEGNRAVQRARALRAFQYQTIYVNRLTMEERVAILQESVTLLRKADFPALRELGISLYFLWSAQRRQNQPTPAREEMLAILQKENGLLYLSEYYYESAYYYDLGREVEQSRECMEKSLVISRAIEDYDGIASRLYHIAKFSVYAGDYRHAEILFNEAIEYAQKVKNRWFVANLKIGFLWIALAQGNYEEVARLGEKAFTNFQELNYPYGTPHLFGYLFQSVWSQGNYPKVLDLARVIAEKYKDDSYSQLYADFYQGRAALSQNDLPQAEMLLKKTFAMEGGPDIPGKERLLLAWTSLLMKQGESDLAAHLLSALHEVYQHTAPGLSPRERSEHDEALTASRFSLGEAAFERAWKEGQAMTLQQGVDLVQGYLVAGQRQQAGPLHLKKD